jgi:hypothetical protein
MLTRFRPTQLSILVTALVACSLPAAGADISLKVTDKGYLDTQGFSIFLYDSTYHPVFVDQKNTAMEMILHGHRIATNGDVRLMPTPEQWDLVAMLKGRQPDKANNRLTANLGFPAFDLSRKSYGREWSVLCGPRPLWRSRQPQPAARDATMECVME